jgi:hypothetical protein
MKKFKTIVTKKRVFENNAFLITFLILQNTFQVSPKSSYNDVYFDNLDQAMEYINLQKS